MKASIAVVLLLAALVAADEARNRRREEWLEKEIKRGAKKLLHVKGESRLEVPVEVDIILIGFEGSGAFGYDLDEERLEDLLIENHEERVPVARETGEPLSSTYLVDYRVRELASRDGGETVRESLTRLEQLMRQSMTREDLPSLIRDKFYAHSEQSPWETYSIDAAAIEPVLTEMVEEVLKGKETAEMAPEWYDRNVIVVMNPCKRRMRPAGMRAPPTEAAAFNLSQWDSLEFDTVSAVAEEGGFGYFYSYNGGGRSATWLSSHNYAVIDVSAGPVEFGLEVAPSGSVSPTSLPRILDVLYQGTMPLAVHQSKETLPAFAKHVASVRDAAFRGRLASVLVSAVNHLYLNDLWLDNTQGLQNIMVPLIALRNHDDFSPFEHGEEHSINGTAVREELEGLSGYEKVIVTESLHSLHQHKALAVALYKSMVAKSEAVVPPTHGEHVIHTRLKHYIDSQVLLREFALAADLLSDAWIDDEDRRRHAGKPTHGHRRSPGQTHTLPVFILSLKDVPFGLAFENDELVVASGEMVIVLQTVGVAREEAIKARYSGHFSEGEPVVVSSVNAERHVVSGLMTALTGLPPPHELYNQERKEVTHNWLWSTGYTPFGPYSATKKLSAVTKLAADRNWLLARLERLLLRIRGTVTRLDDFVAEYSSLFPSREDGKGDLQPETSWTDLLYRKSDSFVEPPLPADVVREIERAMEQIEAKLIQLSHQFFAADFEGADTTLRQLAIGVDSFIGHVNRQLIRAQAKLQCCQREYKAQKTVGSGSLWLAAGVLVLLVFVYVSIPVTVDDVGTLLRR